MFVESAELRRLREQLNNAESVRLKLEYDLEHTHAADNKKTKVISELMEKLQKSEAKCSKVSHCIVSAQHQISYVINTGHCTGCPHTSWLATMKINLSSADCNTLITCLLYTSPSPRD